MLLQHAAHNNAVWCHAVCAAHGIPGQFHAGFWLNTQAVPPYYPNAVTLVPQAQAAPLARTLEAARLPGGWSVKDSFCALDLAPHGCRVLFEAEWLAWPARRPAPAALETGLRWKRVRAVDDLAAWEQAWAGPDAVDSAGRIFLPPLLDNDDVAILAGYADGAIKAGAIVNRSGEAAGLSNVFMPQTEGEHLRPAVVAHALSVFPGLPLVGYEAGGDLAAMRALGFDSLGPLRVWVR